MLHLHCIGGYSPEIFFVASRMKEIFNIKEQSINRAGVVQEDIQPAGILSSCVCIDCFKDLLEVRPEYLYEFK
uniref:Uncharacterized protein n=1 Tax=Athene cunicularia TaxID=194338 RepID=A0A663LWN8_ATHCN